MHGEYIGDLEDSFNMDSRYRFGSRPRDLSLTIPRDGEDGDDNLAKSPIARNLGHHPVTPGTPRRETEYKRTLEVSKAPDMFPCKHVLCHRCIRKHVKDNVMKCPICGTTVQYDAPAVEYGVSGYEEENNNNTMLVTNFDEIVEKFRGIDRPSLLRHMKEDSVQTATIGMTYTSVPCDLCEEDHGNLKVLQELNKLSVQHRRPDDLNGYYYRLCMGDVVTTFYSKVNSSSICVPCTYRGLRKSQQVPAIMGGTSELEEVPADLCLAEVGKLIVKKSAPLVCMQGKNMIEVDHTISIKNRADLFDFNYTAKRIQKMVSQQESTLIKQVTRQINDNGKLYHIQESSKLDIDDDPTVKTEIW